VLYDLALGAVEIAVPEEPAQEFEWCRRLRPVFYLSSCTAMS
jgi:hypothetical protein